MITETHKNVRKNLFKRKSRTVGVVAHVGLIDVGPLHVVDVPGRGGESERAREKVHQRSRGEEEQVSFFGMFRN